jgi:hypothetical protein
LWWSNRLWVVLVSIALFDIARGSVARAGIGCPPTHNDRPLYDVGLFEGPPEDKVESMPEPGRFVVPQVPPEEWTNHQPFTLGCFYDRARKDMVSVVLPRSIRLCDFDGTVQVNCHE